MTQHNENIPNTEQKKDSFWHYCEHEKTYKRDHPRMALKRAKYDILFGKGRFRALRYWRDPRTGEKRQTIEIWPDEVI